MSGTDKENEVVDEVAKTLGLGSVLPEIYQDLLQPAAKELGCDLVTVAKAVTVALSPLSAAVWGFEKFRDWLQTSLTARLAKTPPDQVSPPPSHIAGPLLIHLRFLQSEEPLRELFAGLLACAMDSQRQREVHPAFVSVLQQLSPDEAVLLAFFSKNLDWSISDLWEERRLSKEPSLEEQFAKICRDVAVRYEDQAEAYMDNLIRLRVLTLRALSAPHLESSGSNDYGDWEAHLSEGELRELHITSFGKSFLMAVHYGKADSVGGTGKAAQPEPQPDRSRASHGPAGLAQSR